MTMVLPMSALYPHTQNNCTVYPVCDSVPANASSEYNHRLCTCKRSGAKCSCVWQTRQAGRLANSVTTGDAAFSPPVGRHLADISSDSCVPHFDDDLDREKRLRDPPHHSPGKPSDGDAQTLANISSNPSILSLSSAESRAHRRQVGQKGSKRKLDQREDEALTNNTNNNGKPVKRISPFLNTPKQKGSKRKLDQREDEALTNNTNNNGKPVKRISPFLNTPKQRKEERRKIFRISAQKFRTIEDPEHFLRRSVLIRNTIRKIQEEIREEKSFSRPFSPYSSLMRTKNYWNCDGLNTNYLAQTPAYLFDEPQVSGNEKFDDDTNDVLVSRIEETNNSTPMSISSNCDNAISGNLQEKHILHQMDVVFNSLICALGET